VKLKQLNTNTQKFSAKKIGVSIDLSETKHISNKNQGEHKTMENQKDQNFKAKRVTRTYCQTIHADPAKVYALICPVKEAEWLDGWQYEMIYSQTGLAEEGCVFKSQNEGEADTIWLITKRDDERLETELARLTPDSRIAKLTIRVQAAGNGQSRVDIQYVFTALNETGNQFIDSFSEENFIKDMQFWEASMNHYLETGQKLKNENYKNWLRYQNAK
jgi:hypothetical protein